MVNGASTPPCDAIKYVASVFNGASRPQHAYADASRRHPSSQSHCDYSSNFEACDSSGKDRRRSPHAFGRVHEMVERVPERVEQLCAR